MLRTRFLEVSLFRNISLKCLTEVAGLSVPDSYEPNLVILFGWVVESINNIVPMNPTLGSSECLKLQL